MLSILSVAACCALVASVSAEPKVLGFNFKKEARSESLRARSDAAHALLRGRSTVDVSLGNVQLLYYVNATIGTPGQEFVLQLDTGSSDIWVPWINSNACTARRGAYCAEFGGFDPNESRSFVDISSGFRISYVDGSAISGDYVSDVFNVGGVNIKNMTFGLAKTASRALGIMGIGYTAGESIANTAPDSTYPNVIDQLVAQKLINTKAYSLWLNDLNADYGSILFGGVDTEKYTGSLTALNVLKDSRSDDYSSFGVALSSVTFKNVQGNVDYTKTGLSTPVILDSGTTLTYLPAAIANDIIGGVGAFQSSGTYLVPCSLGNSQATIEFGFGGANGPVISVGIAQFVLPILTDSGRAPALRDGTPVCQWGIQPTEQGTPNLFGDTFLRSAYVVYDLDNNIIAIAPTKFNATKSNVKEISSGVPIPGVSKTAVATASGVAFSGVPLNTAAGTLTGATQLGSSVTATFNLGTPAKTGSSSSGNKASGASGRPELKSVLLGATLVFTSIIGGMLMILA